MSSKADNIFTEERIRELIKTFRYRSDIKELKKLYGEDLDFESVDEILNSLLSEISSETKNLIEVFFGYSWHPKKTVFRDIFWASLRDFLIPIRNSVLTSFKDEVSIFINRLRASHGEFVFDGILNRILRSDLLIFDIAETKDLFKEENGKYNFEAGIVKNNKIQYKSFNPNVLIELGYALGIGKYPIIMCPNNLKDKIPSDLKCYMWTFYEMVVLNEGKTVKQIFSRKFVDQRGIENLLRGRLRKIAKSKIS